MSDRDSLITFEEAKERLGFYVKQQKEREAWLMHHLDVMTFEERRLFWDCLGEIIRGEIKLTVLYQEIKGRVDKQKEG